MKHQTALPVPYCLLLSNLAQNMENALRKMVCGIIKVSGSIVNSYNWKRLPPDISPLSDSHPGQLNKTINADKTSLFIDKIVQILCLIEPPPPPERLIFQFIRFIEWKAGRPLKGSPPNRLKKLQALTDNIGGMSMH